MNPENLSSDQLRNYEQAETLAWEANKVFDISKEFAESFANDYILRQMHGITSNGEAFQIGRAHV